MPTDLDGNVMDFYGRSLYEIKGSTRVGDGPNDVEYDLELLNDPFDVDFGRREDVGAHLVGSKMVLGGNDDGPFHSPVIDIDFPVIQNSVTHENGTHQSITMWDRIGNTGKAEYEMLLGMLRDLELAWDAQIVSHNRDTKIYWSVPVHVVPSTSPGHHHLYINKALEWNEYVGLLAAFEEAQVISDGYLYFCLKRQESHVRYPGVSKPPGAHSSDGGNFESVRSVGGGGVADGIGKTNRAIAQSQRLPAVIMGDPPYSAPRPSPGKPSTHSAASSHPALKGINIHESWSTSSVGQFLHEHLEGKRTATSLRDTLEGGIPF